MVCDWILWIYDDYLLNQMNCYNEIYRHLIAIISHNDAAILLSNQPINVISEHLTKSDCFEARNWNWPMPPNWYDQTVFSHGIAGPQVTKWRKKCQNFLVIKNNVFLTNENFQSSIKLLTNHIISYCLYNCLIKVGSIQTRHQNSRISLSFETC